MLSVILNIQDYHNQCADSLSSYIKLNTVYIVTFLGFVFKIARLERVNKYNLNKGKVKSMKLNLWEIQDWSNRRRKNENKSNLNWAQRLSFIFLGVTNSIQIMGFYEYIDEKYRVGEIDASCRIFTVWSNCTIVNLLHRKSNAKLMTTWDFKSMLLNIVRFRWYWK